MKFSTVFYCRWRISQKEEVHSNMLNAFLITLQLDFSSRLSHLAKFGQNGQKTKFKRGKFEY
jgi:hypothetical protein